MGRGALISISPKFKIKHFVKKNTGIFLISPQKIHSRYSLEALH